MKACIVYASYHHQNTQKVARVMGDVLAAKVLDVTKARQEDVLEADLVGFGSGIYYGKFHESLLEFARSLPYVSGQKAFLFSTAGMRLNVLFNPGHRAIKKILEDKGFKVIGEFSCPGYDTYGPLKYIGGVKKGRPSQEDINKAEHFARDLKKEIKKP